MEVSIIQVAIAISIVIVCAAISIVKIINARAEAQKVARPFFTVGPKDLEEIQRKGSFNISIPGIEEAAKISKKTLSYQEAMFVEQLLNRITVAGLEYSKAEFERQALTARSPKRKVDAVIKRLNDTDRYFLNAIDAAAYWHLQGVLPYSIFEKYFLGTIKHAYTDSSQARRYTNIKEIVDKYAKELLALDK